MAIFLSGCATGAVGGASWPGLSTDGETLYLSYSEAIYAIDPEDGRELWRYPREAERNVTFFAPAVITEEQDLVIGGYDEFLYRLDAENGTFINSAEFDGKFIGPVGLGGDLVLAPNDNRNLYAVERGGDLRWTFTAERSLWAKPIINGDTVYQASMDHNLYAVDLSDGTQIWASNLGGALVDTPTVFEDTFLIGTFSGNLFSVRQNDGSTAWTFETETAVWGNPAMLDGIAFFGDYGGNVYAVDASNGDQLWQQNIGEDNRIRSSPAVTEGMLIFVAEGGEVVAVSTEGGSIEWEQRLEGRLLTDPLILGETVYVAAEDGEQLLTAFNIETGARDWSFTPAEE